MINDLWYKNAVINNLPVGTFQDSDGDDERGRHHLCLQSYAYR